MSPNLNFFLKRNRLLIFILVIEETNPLEIIIGKRILIKIIKRLLY
jgi:hypothetical protein